MTTSPAMEPTVIDTALAEALAAQYPSMLSLDLRSNYIISMQDLRPLSRLRELALDDNRLETLEGLAELKLLTSLSARSNLISDVGGRVTALSSLRVLDLAWNRLAAGPWVHVLATLPHLTELDLQGNPVCDLEGAQMLLAAALPGLQRLNDSWLYPAEAAPPPQPQPEPSGGSPAPLYPSPPDAAPNQQEHPYGEQLTEQAARLTNQGGQQLAAYGGWYDLQAALPVNAAAPPGDRAERFREGASGAHRLFTNDTDGPPCEPKNNKQSWAAQRAQPPEPKGKLPPPEQRQQFRQGEPWALGSELGGWRPTVGAQQSKVGVTELRAQLEAAGQVHSALAEAHAGLVGERERLLQQMVSLEGALRQAEDTTSRLQQQLQQQSAASAQQVAGLASQVAALLAERDAAVAQAEQLGLRLAEAEGRADEAARAAGAAVAQAEQLRDAERQLRRELVATQELLVQQQERSSATQAQATGAVGGAAAGQAPSGGHSGQGGSPGAASPRRGRGGGAGSSCVEAALQQRVEALQRVVRMQERELVRLGGPVASQDAEGGAAPASGAAPPSGSAGAGAGWNNVLQPWREQVQALHEQVAWLGAEGKEQRAEWGQQLAEMREQFTQARTLLELLEQRSREQRTENSQLHARLSQLGAELTDERQRAAGLEQQLATRDVAAQAVRRQLLSFKSHMEQREAALEGRAEQLSAHAARLSYASKRLGFALSLAALRGRGQGPALAQGQGGPRHVALQGMLAASPAAKTATAASSGASSGWTPWSSDYGPGLDLGVVPRGVGSSGGGAGGAAQDQADETPLVAVLRRELANLARDRDMLLQQLAQVSSAAEKRIRQAQTAMQEREARHREALVAARVQAAMHTAEVEADRKVQAAEAASKAQAALLRQQVAAALEAAEELCRRTEAAAGMRLSKAMVRLADMDKQVARLRSTRQRVADELRSAGLQLERLRQEVAAARASEADLRSQLSSRDREAHTRVAELRAAGEEALAAERRRGAEMERLAAKAAAECGQLERQLARIREVKAQQEDARLRRLQTQVHEQEAQLRTLRRERNTLLAELRKLQQGGGRGARQLDGDLADGHADTDTATVGDRGTERQEEVSVVCRGVALSAAALDSFGNSERAARERPAGAQAMPLPALLPQRATGSSAGDSAGLSIRSILRSGLPHAEVAGAVVGDRLSERGGCAAAVQRGIRALASTIGPGAFAADGAEDTQGQAVIGAVPSAAASTPAPVGSLMSGSGSDPLAERLSELEALTAELLSVE